MPILQPATNAIVACLRLVLPSFHHQRYRASLFFSIFSPAIIIRHTREKSFVNNIKRW